MILQQQSQPLVVIRQTDHAYLSGFFARELGNEAFQKPEPFDSFCLAAAEHDLIDAVVVRHIANHGGDAQQSLQALSALGSAAASLAAVADADVQASLAQVPADPWATTLPLSKGSLPTSARMS